MNFLINQPEVELIVHIKRVEDSLKSNKNTGPDS